MDTIRKSFLAGILIGIGGIAYLSIPYKVLGAFLFSFGLLTILIQNYYLYTGKIGNVRKVNEISFLLQILLFNILGVIFMGVLSSFFLRPEGIELIELKMNVPWIEFFIKSFLCGIMMYYAVQLYSKTSNFLAVIVPIMLFILCGFEHSIANIFYFSVSRIIGIREIIFMITAIIGNSLGSLFVSLLTKK